MFFFIQNQKVLYSISVYNRHEKELNFAHCKYETSIMCLNKKSLSAVCQK